MPRPFPRLGPLLAAALSTALFTSVATAQAPRLLGAQLPANGQGELVDISMVTAQTSSTGAIGVEVKALAASGTGTLYAVDNTATRLVTLDPTTGAIQNIVGSLNGRTMEALCVHPLTGELWGFMTQGSALVRIAPSNAQMVIVAVAPISSPGGITWSADGSALYAVDSATGGFYDINTISGAATLIGVGGAGSNGGPVGLATNPVTGVLYVAEDRGGADMTLATVDPMTGMRTNVGTMTGYDNVQGLAVLTGGNVGINYCTPANPNSTGLPAAIYVLGSPVVAANDMTLGACDLPPTTFGFFLASRLAGFVANPSGSEGNLCLGGSIGRYVGPGQIQQSGFGGQITLAIDLTLIPQPTGFVAGMAGDSWKFQAWYRDSVNGVSTSNFTDGVEVILQ